MVVENLIFNIRRQGDIGATSMNRLAVSLKRLGKESTSASHKMNKLIRALGRVALYRVLRTIIKEISQAFMDGLKNVYQYSKTINSAISQALDSISGASLQMKNQMGAALGELIATIQPIVEALINLVTRAADALSQLFALLGGRGFYHKATEATNEWAAAAGGAAKKAKEWKNQLMGFDEINRLEEPANSGGGGGGAGTNIGNWELAPVDIDLGWFGKYVQATKDWIAQLDFKPLMESWERLKDVMVDFAKILDGAVFWAYTNVLLPLGKWVIEDAAPSTVKLLASAFDFLNAVLEKLGPVFDKFWNEKLKPIAEWIGEKLIAVIDWLSQTFSGLAEKVRNSDSWDEFIDSLEGSEYALLGLIAVIGIAITTFLAFQHPILAIIAVGLLLIANWDKIKETFGKVIDFIKRKLQEWKQKWDDHVHNMLQKSDELKEKIENFKEEFRQKVEDIKRTLSGWKTAVQSAIGAIKGFFSGLSSSIGILNRIKSAVEGITSACRNAVSWLNSVSAKNIEASGGIWNSLNYSGGYPTQYATGGFPEDGLFMANHGELVGQFSNGRTAVANNEQIIAGIERGVFNAVSSAISGKSGGSSQPIYIQLDGKTIAKSTTQYQKQIARATGG